jgi:hypothetical protein
VAYKIYRGKWRAAAQGHLEFVESLTLTHNSRHQGDLAPLTRFRRKDKIEAGAVGLCTFPLPRACELPSANVSAFLINF